MNLLDQTIRRAILTELARQFDNGGLVCCLPAKDQHIQVSGQLDIEELTGAIERALVGDSMSDEERLRFRYRQLKAAASDVSLAAWTDRFSRLHGHPSVVKLDAVLRDLPPDGTEQPE